MKGIARIAAILVLVDAARAEDAIDYIKQIKPVLQARCYGVSWRLEAEGRSAARHRGPGVKGGKNGTAITPGDAGPARCIERVSARRRIRTDAAGRRATQAGGDRRAADMDSQGAKAPADEQPERDPREHWAFRTPSATGRVPRSRIGRG